MSAELPKELQDAIRRGCLLSYIADHYFGKPKANAEFLINLHNSGQIDLLKEFSDQQKLVALKHKNYELHLAFEELLPSISGNTIAAATCVKNIAALFPNSGPFEIIESLYKFCDQSADKTEELLNIALIDQENAMFTATALAAGATFDADRSFSKAHELFESTHDENYKYGALVALSNISLSKEQFVGRFLQIVEKFICTPMSDEFCRLLSITLSELYCKKSHDGRILNLLKKTALYAGEKTYLAIVLLLNSLSNRDSAYTKFALSTLCNVQSPSKKIIRAIDGLSHQFVQGEYRGEFISLIETMISKVADLDFNRHLDSLQYVVSNNIKLRNVIISKWLSSENIGVCKACGHLLNIQEEGSKYLSFDSELTENCDRLYIAQNAVSFLYIYPHHCTNFLLSMVETLTARQQKQILRYIKDFLLMSYPMSVCETIGLAKNYLSKSTYSKLEQILSDHQKYSDKIIEAKQKTQLSPTEQQKFVCQRLDIERQREVHKRTSELSIASKLCKTVVLLYPGKWVSIINNASPGNSHAQRIVTDLTSLGVSAEIPLLTIVDPLNELYTRRRLSSHAEECESDEADN